ncbi:MAG: hypothetical protein ABSF83_04765 [Nitrososphaerales archaeon]
MSWVDSFDLPSVFDHRGALYKEWHDFVFFDRRIGLFGLLNFAVLGNPHDEKRGYGAALTFLVDPDGRAHASMKLIPLAELSVSPYSPDFLAGSVNVSYRPDRSFDIRGEIDGVSLDLNMPVVLPPVTMNQIGSDILARGGFTLGMFQVVGEMAQVWDKWVELPRLGVTGTVRVGGATYSIETQTGYQDHEGGRFDWGSLPGWDTGVLLCDPQQGGGEPAKVSFLFYRYGTSGESEYGGVIVRTPGGEEAYFGSGEVTITRSGEFSGERAYLPGVTRLLYPDYAPRVPATTTFSASGPSGSLRIVFTPRAVCTIVVPSASNDSETVFNEMYCTAELESRIGGTEYRGAIPCWFESVRPRGRVVKGDPGA